MSQVLENVAPADAKESPLGQKSAHGFVWLLGQGLTSKVVTMVGQIILARLLGSNDFGFVGLAYTIPIFVGIIQQGGTREILIRRQKHFHLWANAAFWLSLTLGLISSMLMLLLAPLANGFFRNPDDPTPNDQRLTILIIILAAQSFVNAFSVVSETKLQIDLRFKFQAFTGLAFVIATMTMSIVLALLGLGSYAYILPLLIITMAKSVIYLIVAPPPLRWKLQFRRWMYMLNDSGIILLQALFSTFTWQGGYLILGRMYPKPVVGDYFWSSNLSTQSLVLIGLSLGSVLLPSLAKLANEPQRQRQAFIRAAKAMAIIGIPACFLQATMADAGVRLVFPKWTHAITLLQVLSLAASLQVVGYAGLVMMKAQGRFKQLMWVTFGLAVFIMVTLQIGALYGAALGTAMGMFVYCWVGNPWQLYMALKSMRGTWRDTFGIFTPATLVAIAASVPAYGVDLYLASLGGGRTMLLVRMATVTIITAAIYIPLIRIAQREAYNDLLARGRGIIKRGQ